jgi:uncharacterized phage-associated protein
MTNRRARYTAAHIANYILRYFHVNKLEITHLKLQKLLYIAYGWNLVLNKEHPRLFDESIQAWKLGPVIPSVYYYFKGKWRIEDYMDGEEQNPIPSIKEDDLRTINIVNAVINFYGNRDARDLVEIVHNKNSPWDKVYNKNGPGSGTNQPLNDDEIKKRCLPAIENFLNTSQDNL